MILNINITKGTYLIYHRTLTQRPHGSVTAVLAPEARLDKMRWNCCESSRKIPHESISLCARKGIR